MTTNGATGVNGSALAVVKRGAEEAFEPRSIDEALNLAGLLVQSRLLPKSIGTAEAAFAIIATGRELGLTVMQSLRSIHVIEGKPTLSADLVCALVKKHPACQYFRLVTSTGKIATYETQRAGEPSPTSLSFTIEQAQAADVTGKDNWRKYPDAMLRARCIMALTRAVYPDATIGVYDPDEVGAPEPAPTQARVTAVVSADIVPDFEDSIAEAKTADELREVGRYIANAKKKKTLTPEAYDRLLALYKAKGATLKAPGAPPSAPAVQHTTDGEIVEAEIVGRQPGEEG